ncbi:MAG TPA: hypothetical protein VN750_06255 [Steroidobacteraceae bacterium]|nr:hypothetical protein [Steroidobacteraceae bacterium]
MGQSVSPHLQEGYKGLAGLVGSDYADGISHLADLGLNGLAVLPAVEPLSTVGPADQASADLTANPGLAQSFMSPGSYDHLVNGTSLASASFGKAVERLTAQYVQSDPVLSSQFEYLSKPFVSTPDFAGTIDGNTYRFDITTNASVTSHLTRSYGPTTTLPPGLVFPQ